jgi:hypothetical protein
VTAAISLSTWALLAQTHGLGGEAQAQARIDAIKTALTAGAGTGGAVEGAHVRNPSAVSPEVSNAASNWPPGWVVTPGPDGAGTLVRSAAPPPAGQGHDAR